MRHSRPLKPGEFCALAWLAATAPAPGHRLPALGLPGADGVCIVVRKRPRPGSRDKLGPDHPAFPVIVDLVGKGRARVKLVGAYLNTEQGPPYADATRIAQAFVARVQRLAACHGEAQTG
jgi:hypothetical protein